MSSKPAGLLRGWHPPPLPAAQSPSTVSFQLDYHLKATLSGGVVLRGRDGALRDPSSIRGTYQTVQEIDRAIGLAAAALLPLAPSSVRWLLNRPVSNSGRLAARLRE